MEPLFTNEAVVFGILVTILALIFYTSSLQSKGWQRFYTFVPPLLLCYFIPAILTWPLGLIGDPDDKLYFVASRFLLPAALILLCLNIDLKGLIRLGPKALIMFFTATAGIVIGGPVALIVIQRLTPGLVEIPSEQLWTGMSTIAGSWIGGGANQLAMKEVFNVSDTVFSSMVVVDIVIANIWMAILLYGAGITRHIDRWLKADTTAIKSLETSLDNYRASVQAIPTTTDLFTLLALAFGGVAISHASADWAVPFMAKFKDWLISAKLQSLLSPFFWLVVVATTVGLLLSFTRFRKYEGYGASKWGSICIYLLVATIGMKMNFQEIFQNLGLFAIGIVWMIVHITLLLIVAKLIKAPFFFVAVGSQANVGGAASAPIVASAFSPSLSVVGVLMAVLGYALGTYFAIVSAFIMQAVTL